MCFVREANHSQPAVCLWPKRQPAVGQLGNYDLNSLLAPTSFRPATRELCRTSRCEGALRDRKLMRCKRQYQL